SSDLISGQSRIAMSRFLHTVYTEPVEAQGGATVSANVVDIAWRVGGPQGKGVDTAAGVFGRAAAAGGFFVFGRREYYSNIMGRHSYFDIRVATHPVAVHRNPVDILVTFETETLVRHALAVAAGGLLLHDAGAADVPIRSEEHTSELQSRENLVCRL